METPDFDQIADRLLETLPHTDELILDSGQQYTRHITAGGVS